MIVVSIFLLCCILITDSSPICELCECTELEVICKKDVTLVDIGGCEVFVDQRIVLENSPIKCSDCDVSIQENCVDIFFQSESTETTPKSNDTFFFPTQRPWNLPVWFPNHSTTPTYPPLISLNNVTSGGSNYSTGGIFAGSLHYVNFPLLIGLPFGIVLILTVSIIALCLWFRKRANRMNGMEEIGLHAIRSGKDISRYRRKSLLLCQSEETLYDFPSAAPFPISSNNVNELTELESEREDEKSSSSSDYDPYCLPVLAKEHSRKKMA